jgi:steroid 5-alpha reductase family enzyme
MGIPAALTIPQRSTDFSRYEYTKIRWEREGIIAKSELKHEENGSKSEKLSKLMLFDVALQLAANVGVCLLPGLILAYDSFFFESLADIQKMSFAAKPDGTLELIRAVLENVCSVGSNCVDRSRICEDGLWAWSRHPNYFGQWMIWVSYAFASLGTILRRRSEFGVVLTIVYVGLLFDMVL